MGSGKSTQMKLLKSEFRKKGLKFKVSNIKSGIFSSFLASFLVRILVGKRRDKAPIMVLITEKPFFRKLFKLWLILDMFVCAYKFVLGVYIPLKIGYKVLAEDYLQSVIADHIYYGKLLNISIKRLRFVFRFLLRLLYLSKSNCTIFLDADLNTLKFRHLQRGDLYEDLNYVYNQQSVLKYLSKIYQPLNGFFVYINTNKNDVKMTHNQILSFFI